MREEGKKKALEKMRYEKKEYRGRRWGKRVKKKNEMNGMARRLGRTHNKKKKRKGERKMRKSEKSGSLK